MLVVAALGFALLRAPLLSLPLERDEGEYAYIAQRAQQGEVPYRDAFDQKPPGIFAAYLAAFTLFGESVESIRVFMHLWSLGTALLLFLLVRALAGELAAAFAVLVFALASIDPSLHAQAANTEIFLLLPMVASMLCLVRGLESPGLRWWLASGALAVAACWFKQVAAFQLLFVAAWALAGRERGRRIGAVLAGGGAVAAPVVLFFVAVGAWEPFLDAVFLHNLAYSSEALPGTGWGALRRALGHQAPSLGLFWGVALAALLRGGWRGRGLLAGWLGFSLAGVAVGLHFRPHYFIQALPPLAACAGVGLAALARRLTVVVPGGTWVAVAALLAVVVAPSLLAHAPLMAAGSPAARSRQLYGLNPFPESLEIARHIARTSRPEESIFVVGSEPQIYFYAERPSASRYIIFYPLMGAYDDALERQQEVMAQVEAGRPRYVVWTNIPTSLLRTSESEDWIFGAVDRMLVRDYRLEFVVHPDDPGATYEFAYGRDGIRWLLDARNRIGELPWIAIYRRSP